MSKVTFVNEHRVVDAAPGASVRAAAKEAGVALDVARFQGALSCGGLGICRACRCWGEESAPGAGGPRTWVERLRGLNGWRRLACRTRVTADVKVYSIPAAANRVAQPRSIAAVPSPVHDPSAPRKPNDAASTAAHVHGHPSAVGRGGPSAGTGDTVGRRQSRPNAARSRCPDGAAPRSDAAGGGDDGVRDRVRGHDRGSGSGIYPGLVGVPGSVVSGSGVGGRGSRVRTPRLD